MHIYKFRMLSGENDNFVRDIEIQAAQTFKDFHDAIADCVNLKDNDLASFHICDQKWNKNTEITLIDMLDGESEDEVGKMVEDTHIMHESKIRNFINEPHQRLLYEYDFINLKTFFIELLSVYKQKDDDPYPRCTLRRGEPIEDPIPEESFEDDEEVRAQLLEDFDELLGDTLEEFNENDTSIDP
ncbi:MAG: plasmid pRiA4b ORF-3 family protein [Bacteroidales bacterium]|nr:plasmid pRiA4b ORF-3 family protein [Bacteroidales bacterium]MCF8402791.1 plasmid pRiA4b ORF-3 family protein [Bacteroidales bacterium]